MSPPRDPRLQPANEGDPKYKIEPIRRPAPESNVYQKRAEEMGAPSELHPAGIEKPTPVDYPSPVTYGPGGGK